MINIWQFLLDSHILTEVVVKTNWVVWTFVARFTENYTRFTKSKQISLSLFNFKSKIFSWKWTKKKRKKKQKSSNLVSHCKVHSHDKNIFIHTKKLINFGLCWYDVSCWNWKVYGFDGFSQPHTCPFSILCFYFSFSFSPSLSVSLSLYLFSSSSNFAVTWTLCVKLFQRMSGSVALKMIYNEISRIFFPFFFSDKIS